MGKSAAWEVTSLMKKRKAFAAFVLQAMKAAALEVTWMHLAVTMSC